ncbi:hypothetical protein ACHAXS_009852 [Conticribra weissflogii]
MSKKAVSGRAARPESSPTESSMSMDYSTVPSTTAKGSSKTEKSGGKRKSRDKDKSYKDKEKSHSHQSQGAAADLHQNSSSSAHANNPISSIHNNHSTNFPSSNTMKRTEKFSFHHSTPPQLDPILLGRGLSSRYISSKISNSITTLTKDQIEKDLRHMEAYRNACRAYSQQLFVYENQDLCRSGYFGMFVPVGSGGTDTLQGNPNSVSSANGIATVSSGSSNGAKPYALPSKIDPDEEKRLAVLRKKIHQSEFQREQLETEYLSLRAHYVHESQLVRKTRAYEMGRWKLLRDLMKRRGKVLALMRVKAAMARDVEKLLTYRGKLLEEAKRGGFGDGAGGGSIGGKDSCSANKKEVLKSSLDETNSNSDSNLGIDVPDLIEVWNNVDAQLKEAEIACMELETPDELLQMITSSDGSSSDRSNHNNQTRSPTRKSSSDDTDGGSKKRSRSESIASTEEGTDSSDGKEKRGSKTLPPSGAEPHVIPWDSVVDPMTPYEMPVVLSCLSAAPDKTVGYLMDKSKPDAITWLESTLPESSAAYDSDKIELEKLREEARLLKDELAKEIESNTELQKEINSSRVKNNQMVCMMQVLRNETEAVLERHNLLLETPEARAKAAELHRKMEEEEDETRNAANAEGEDYEEEYDEEDHDDEGDGDDHGDGELDEHEADRDHDHDDDFSQDDDGSVEEGEIHEDDDEGKDGDVEEDDDDEEDDEEEHVNIKEVIVNPDDNEAVNGDTEDEDDDEEEEGEIIEDDEMEEGEIDEDVDEHPRKHGHDDEESSNYSNQNSNSYSKRGRYEENH